MSHSITLTVSIDEANLILEALGNQSSAKVCELVDSIQQQAQAQLGDPVSTGALDGRQTSTWDERTEEYTYPDAGLRIIFDDYPIGAMSPYPSSL